MKLYSENKDYKLYNGNMLDMLEVIETNSIDSIVCDPPYELNFMGKGWDNSGIAFNSNAWKKCFEVLKPGGYLLAFGGSRTYHRIACAIEDAGFEIRDCIMWLYGCYSSDTQVLTDKGWKYFYELDKTEKIMQWNKDTNELSWVKPLNYFEYYIDDEMVLLENRHTSQLITKNHKVVCDLKNNHKQYTSKYNFIEAKDIKKTDSIKLPLASHYYGALNYEYAYMIGWWLTDAWKHENGKACMFSQSKTKTLNKLRMELERLKALGKCDYSEYIKKSNNPNHKDEHIFYVTGDVANYLLKNFPCREFKAEFIELDKSSKELLLDGLMDGDGSYKSGEYSNVFLSKNETRNDIMSALLTTMGYRNYISYSNGHQGVIFNTKHNTTEIQYKHKKPTQHYIGKVYCLQTETGAFVIRRNGKPFISGNSGFPKSMNIGLAIDKKNGVESEIIGTGKSDVSSRAFQSEDTTTAETYNLRIAANEWNGWGTCLKPAYEPIIVARKPFKGSLIDNIEKNRVGGLNIDECRVGNEIIKGGTIPKFNSHNDGINIYNFDKKNAERLEHQDSIGRFPANVILTYDETDYNEVCGGMPNTKSYESNYNFESSNNDNPSHLYTNIKSGIHYGDNGSASRYFYCAKVSKKDRDEGLEDFQEKQVTDNCIRTNQETARKFGANSALRKNIHPTVKPTSLMQYLVRLVTPKEGTILDPFMGSGSTGKSVMYENLERNANYKFIGIELTDEYLPIAKARIDYANQKIEESKFGQMKMSLD